MERKGMKRVEIAAVDDKRQIYPLREISAHTIDIPRYHP